MDKLVNMTDTDLQKIGVPKVLCLYWINRLPPHIYVVTYIETANRLKISAITTRCGKRQPTHFCLKTKILGKNFPFHREVNTKKRNQPCIVVLILLSW